MTAALLLVAATSAFGQVSYSTGFESPTFTAGLALTGQDSWVAGSGTGTNVPAVSSTMAYTGTQSVQLNGYPGAGSTFTSSGRAFAAGTPAGVNPMLAMSARLWVDSIAADRYFGIQFGTAAGATSTSLGMALSGNGLRGGGGGYANFNGLATGLLQARTTADFLGRWVGLSVVADRTLTTNNVVYTFTGLGTSGGLATETFTTSVNFGTQNITHIAVVADWSDTSTGSTGLAFVDDVSFSASPVPEPASMAALGLGALALIRRRKKA
jgi:hypothetical protein